LKSFNNLSQILIFPILQFLQDLEAPIISTSSDFTNLIQDQWFTMNCSANGYPSPSYYWLRNGNIIQNGSTIVIDQIAYKQMGMYKCIASSFVIEMSSQVDLSVSCKQSCIKLYILFITWLICVHDNFRE